MYNTINSNELIKSAQNGDKASLETLVAQNMGLVKRLAIRFKDRGCEYDDLVQIGTIGMIKAIKSFDFSFNTVFSTYAVPLIIGEIRRYLRDDGLIKVSRSIRKNGIDVMRKKEEFEKTNTREPTVSELSEICGLSNEDIITALEAMSPVRSLQEPLNDDESSFLGNIISDNDNKIDRLTESIALREAMSGLSELHKKIVYLRYFRDMSQQQTGDIMGLSQVKISREEKKIMNYLRKAL